MYASRQDLIDVYGVKNLPGPDPEASPPNLDETKIQRALEDAGALINRRWRWLLVRDENGDLPEPPEITRRICVEIAFFYLTDAVSSSEDARKRFDWAMDELKRGEGLRECEAVEAPCSRKFLKNEIL